VFSTANGTLVRTIPDSVDLAKFGIPGHCGGLLGSPVEVAFSPDRLLADACNFFPHPRQRGRWREG